MAKPPVPPKPAEMLADIRARLRKGYSGLGAGAQGGYVRFATAANDVAFLLGLVDRMDQTLLLLAAAIPDKPAERLCGE